MTLTVCGIRSPLLLESSEQSDGRLRRLRPRDVSTTRQRGPCFGKLRLSWGIRPLMPPHEKLSAETEEEAQAAAEQAEENKNLRLCARSRGRVSFQRYCKGVPQALPITGARPAAPSCPYALDRRRGSSCRAIRELGERKEWPTGSSLGHPEQRTLRSREDHRITTTITTLNIRCPTRPMRISCTTKSLTTTTTSWSAAR